jgi:nitrate/nitrite transporter NarK
MMLTSLLDRLVLGLLLNITFGFLSHIIPAQLLMVLGCIGTATSCLLSALMDTSASYWTYNFASVALSVVGPDFVVCLWNFPPHLLLNARADH